MGYDRRHILKYVNGKRRGKTANRMEREAMRDAFLAEALSGYAKYPNGHHTYRVRQMRRKVKTGKLRAIWRNAVANMARSLHIYNREWIELVFAGKNQTYGGYILRKYAARRHLLAYAVTICLAAIILALPTVMQQLNHAPAYDLAMTELSNIQMDAPEENIVKEFDAPPPPPLKSAMKFTVMEVKDDKDVADEEVKTMEELTIAKDMISVADVQGTNDEMGEDISDLREHKVVMEVKEDEVFDNAAVEQQAAFPGGESEILRWIDKNLEYPSAAKEMGLSGRVIVKFEIGKDGKVRNVQILKGADKLLDDVVKKTIEKMPPWIPAKQSGRPVAVRYILPVVFHIE
ncbi:MAG: energy transducer TonB [Prevotellaceae bacterium]|jgi:protein TonB|nr:energy transducer TonB [Prevotellaceae bacterium]